jgi:predicted DNA-binding protein with PD1-like motif
LINMHGAAADTKGQVWGGHLFRDENPTFPAMDVEFGDGEFSGKYAL